MTLTQNGEPEKRFQLGRFTRDVLYDSIVQITSTAIQWAALALLAVLVAMVALGWEVPAWTLILVMLLGLGLRYITKRVADQEVNELRPRLNAAEDKLDRHDSYGTNICSIMDNFQRVLAGDIRGVTVPEFIERGILTAGRDVMQENGHASDLRMSVLLAKDGNFTMGWASGHNIQSQKKYRQPIEKTVSRIAYEKKVMHVWKDIAAEERSFEENPHATRKFRSMASIPILIGDHPVGVFNVVTEQVDAFDVADINYLTSLGAVIQTAVGVAVKEAKGSQGAQVAQPDKRAGNVAATQAKTPIVRTVLPQGAPGGDVGSGHSQEGTEASDE